METFVEQPRNLTAGALSRSGTRILAVIPMLVFSLGGCGNTTGIQPNDERLRSGVRQADKSCHSRGPRLQSNPSADSS